MVRIYGIHNCDTMQKAIKWLRANGVAFEFHNYKESGIDKATLERWLQQVPLAQLLNARSTTFKDLPEADRAAASDPHQAIALMIAHPSIIKRPVWDFGNGNYVLGWNEAEVRKMLHIGE